MYLLSWCSLYTFCILFKLPRSNYIWQSNTLLVAPPSPMIMLRPKKYLPYTSKASTIASAAWNPSTVKLPLSIIANIAFTDYASKTGSTRVPNGVFSPPAPSVVTHSRAKKSTSSKINPRRSENVPSAVKKVTTDVTVDSTLLQSNPNYSEMTSTSSSCTVAYCFPTHQRCHIACQQHIFGWPPILYI